MIYEWVFGPATVTNIDGISDVVIVVNWVCIMTADNGDKWKNSGRVTVPQVDPSSYVPFDQITQEIVEGWVYSQVDKAQVEASMLEQYQDSIKTQVLPFNF